jgi:hypothetical protein
VRTRVPRRSNSPRVSGSLPLVKRRKRCIVLLASSVRAELIYPQFVEFALSNTTASWW